MPERTLFRTKPFLTNIIRQPLKPWPNKFSTDWRAMIGRQCAADCRHVSRRKGLCVKPHGESTHCIRSGAVAKNLAYRPPRKAWRKVYCPPLWTSSWKTNDPKDEIVWSGRHHEICYRQQQFWCGKFIGRKIRRRRTGRCARWNVRKKIIDVYVGVIDGGSSHHSNLLLEQPRQFWIGRAVIQKPLAFEVHKPLKKTNLVYLT